MHSNKHSIFIFVSLVVSMSLLFTVFSSAKPSKENGNTPQIVGTVISTSNPGSVKRQLKGQGIGVKRAHKLSTGKSLISVEEDYNPGVAKALGLKKQVDNGSVEVYPNYLYKAQFDPDDPKYINSDQWNLKKINAPKAWDISTGSSETVIAVIDTGVLFQQTWDGGNHDYTQPDFPTTKRWENESEKGMTQIGEDCYDPIAGSEDKTTNDCDDDKNGFEDDWQGWDFMGGWRGGADCPNNTEKSSDVEHPEEPNYVTEDNDPQPYSCDNFNHTDLLNKIHYNGECNYGTDTNNNNKVDGNGGACYIGHGTLVGSVASAATNNATLVAGVDNNAKIMNLRALDGYGAAHGDEVTAAIDYATANGADTINLSLCVFGAGEDSLVETALQNAVNSGVIPVAASGNSGKFPVCYPASSSNTIAVGASNSNDKRASFSTYGNDLDLIAPGADVPGAIAPSKKHDAWYGETDYKYHPGANGTSLATPHVVGAAALLKGLDSTTDLQKVLRQLNASSRRVSGMKGKVFHKKYGNGRLDLNSLLKIATGESPVYRLYSPAVKRHFYTKNLGERDSVASNLNYRYEGIGFWVCTSSENIAGSVYRLYHQGIKKHFFTKSKTERDNVVNELGYTYEGVAFPSCNASGFNSVHRLYSHDVKNHFYTSSEKEKDFVENVLGFPYEGKAFWVK